MNKKKYFLSDPPIWTAFYIFVSLACIALLFVFWSFKNYAAFAFLLLMLFAVINEALSYVTVDKERVIIFEGGRAKEKIPADEIRRLDTQAGRHEKMVIYGENGMIAMAFNKKAAEAVLKAAGADEEVTSVFLQDGEDMTVENKTGKVIKETVFLDRLNGKKKYVHRQAILPVKEKEESEEKDAADGKTDIS